MRTLIKAVSEVLSTLLVKQSLDGIQDQIVPLEKLYDLTRAYDWLGE